MQLFKNFQFSNLLRKVFLPIILNFFLFFFLSNITFNINSEIRNLEKINHETYNVIF